MRHNQGFSLIELLIVVTILAIVAALAIPNLLNAIDRSRQSSTISDLRAIATALERYSVDHQGYPRVADVAALRSELEPHYIKSLPTRDGWRHPLRYAVAEDAAAYTLDSPGKDGVFQDGPPSDDIHDFGADIVLVDGVFVGLPGNQETAAEDAG